MSHWGCTLCHFHTKGLYTFFLTFRRCILYVILLVCIHSVTLKGYIPSFTLMVCIHLVILSVRIHFVTLGSFIPFYHSVRGSGQGLFRSRQFLRLHQPPGDDLTWPLSPRNPFWSEESAAAPAAGTSWPRLAPSSSERSWRPPTLEGAVWNVLYLMSTKAHT